MRLHAKLLAWFIVFGVALALATGLAARQAVHEVLVRNLQAPALSRAGQVRASMRVGLALPDGLLLHSYLRGCLLAFGASYAAGLDSEGRLVAAESEDFPASSGEAPEAFHLLAVRAERPLSREVLGARPVLELAIPVREEVPGGGGRRQGALLLGFSLGGSLATERDILRRVLLFAGIAGAMGFSLLLLTMRRILSPVRELELAVDRIGKGDFGAQVRVGGDDEVGDLAGRFNEMSRELARTTVSAAFLAEIMAGMLDALFVTDARGRLRLVNRAALELLGYAENELSGQPVELLLPAEERSFLSGAGLRVINRETRLLAKSGAALPVLLSTSSLRAGDGEVVTGAIWAARDITELKRNQEALRRRERELHHSQKMSAVGQLAAGIAHEINNPLGSILVFAQAVARKFKRSHPLSRPLRGIEEEAVRCKELVQNLLLFSRRERKYQEVFDLNDVVRRSLSLIEAQARLGGVRVEKAPGPALRVRADRVGLQQVVFNLCANALDAMTSGGTLTVRTRSLSGRAVIEVQDTGTGIPAGIRDRIFEPFFTTKGVGKGTGLGLALVHEIVRKQNGKVEVDSEPGRGSVFRVILPLVCERLAAKA